MKAKILVYALPVLILATIHPAESQQETTKIYRVGFLSGAFPGPSHWTTRLRVELRKLRYIEGKNIAIESRYSENRFDRLPALAEELVRLKPDVIVAGGRNDTRAARNATRTIPIVGQSLLDPIADGLLDSLARPGGNVTGSPLSRMCWSANGWSCSRKLLRISPVFSCCGIRRTRALPDSGKIAKRPHENWVCNCALQRQAAPNSWTLRSKNRVKNEIQLSRRHQARSSMHIESGSRNWRQRIGCRRSTMREIL